MSRAIPQVRAWCLKYYTADAYTHRRPARVVVVHAPTRTLALLQAPVVPVGGWRTVRSLGAVT